MLDNRDVTSIENDAANVSIIVLKDTDKVEVVNDETHIGNSEKKFCFKIDDINKLAILTTDRGPFEDDVALTISTKENIFVIPSEHPLYENFLFDEISKKIVIDYQKIIDASSCTENAEFILFLKQ